LRHASSYASLSDISATPIGVIHVCEHGLRLAVKSACVPLCLVRSGAMSTIAANYLHIGRLQGNIRDRSRPAKDDYVGLQLCAVDTGKQRMIVHNSNDEEMHHNTTQHNTTQQNKTKQNKTKQNKLTGLLLAR
jgi:hypothetical protein